jgi:hypothetical protein
MWDGNARPNALAGRIAHMVQRWATVQKGTCVCIGFDLCLDHKKAINLIDHEQKTSVHNSERAEPIENVLQAELCSSNHSFVN